jgi:hypothetical protein
MKVQHNNFECPSEDIAFYIDGELDLARELELDAHFSTCAVCTRELNQQKQFLCGLESSLKYEGEPELPANFTKLIVTNAESHVSGLRRPAERFNAIFICVAFVLFFLFAMGSEAGKMLAGFYLVLDQIVAVGGFFGHLVYSVFLGITIVSRTFAAQFRLDVLIALVFALLFAASTLFVSRKVLRIRRA